MARHVANCISFGFDAGANGRRRLRRGPDWFGVQQSRRFRAALPSRHFGVRQTRAPASTNRRNTYVTRPMAASIVDLLALIDVEAAHGQRAARLTRLGADR
jgi:hypothetical protein